MKQILIILGLFASVSTFAQSPRIKLNQITKDTVNGSVLISSPSDSGMVYSRDFYVAYGSDTVLILYGDTLAATSGIISSVLSDGVTITGNGTSGNELKVDTSLIATIKALNDSLATISASTTPDNVTITGDGSVGNPLKVDTLLISTIKALNDTLTARGYLTANETITLSGDVTGSGTTAITATVVDDSHNHIISNVDFLQDSLTAKANASELSNYLLTSNYIVDSTRINATGDTAFYYQNGVEIGSQSIAGGGGTSYNNISETADTVFIDKYLNVDTSTLYVDATNNRVGIGTSTPSYNLDVNGDINVNAANTNDVMYIRGTFNGTNTAADTGVIRFGGGEPNQLRGYLEMRQFYDGTYTDTDFGIIATDGGVQQSEIVTFKGTGNVGIGTTSPSEKLDVNGNARFRSIGSGASSGALHYTSTGVLTTNTSDARLKTNLQPLDNTLNKLLGINTYTFNWIDETDRVDLGMIAQEVEQIFPNLVFTNSVDGYKGIHYDKFSSILTKAIQEQQAQIETLQTVLDAKSLIIETQEQTITDLQTTIQSLITRIEILENK